MDDGNGGGAITKVAPTRKSTSEVPGEALLSRRRSYALISF